MCDRAINIAQISAIFRFEFGMVLMSIYVFHFIKKNKKTSIENKDSATIYYKQYTNTNVSMLSQRSNVIRSPHRIGCRLYKSPRHSLPPTHRMNYFYDIVFH